MKNRTINKNKTSIKITKKSNKRLLRKVILQIKN